MASDFDSRLCDLERRLSQVDLERGSLIDQIKALRLQIEGAMASQQVLLGRRILDNAPSSNLEKVALFLNLFRARHDVFPRRWENTKNGKSGYSPVCANEWNRPVCAKPKIKCTDCPNQRFLPLDELAVQDHLRGSATIGTYAIKEDDSCVFLACDFDESSWRIDVATYRDTARALGIDVAIEVSRSGNGAHAWIFFGEPISARLARSLARLY